MSWNTDGDKGEAIDGKTDEEKKESDFLEVKMTETEKVWEHSVELKEESKVVRGCSYIT